MDRQLLSRATDNSDAPTPGYMYVDIAKNAAGNPQTCADVAKYLTGRLSSKNNSNVKFKCLKVIAKTAVSPYMRGQFKRCLSQNPQAMAAIKDATQFRGPPDPVRGDEPYDKVRKAAKEALDAVYSDNPQADPSSGGGSFASSVSGSYGNSAGAGGGYGGAPGGGPRRMEGIGNPMFKDPRLEPESQGIGNMSVNEFVSEAKSTVFGMIKDPLARNVNMSQGGAMPRPGGGYSGPAGSFNTPPPGRSELMNQTNGQWSMASNRGSSAVAPPPNYANDAAYYKSRDSSGSGQSYSWAQANSGNAISGGVGGSWGATPSISVNTVPGVGVGVGAGVSGGAGVGVSDGSYEKQLVMELCPPGGMKPEPPPDKIAQFARVVSGLNPDFICPVILDCLEEGQPWIIRAKALWVMEACIKYGQKHGAPNNGYADFFHACNGEFAPMAVHSRAAIRDPAKRVLNLLGVATPVGGAPMPPVRGRAPAAAPPTPVVNLLDFDDGTSASAPAPAAPPPPPQQSPPPASTGGGSLFGGLNVVSAPAAAPVAAAPAAENNLFDFMSGDSAAPAAPSAAPVDQKSSFGFMNSADAAPAPPVAAAAAPTDATNMFGNLSLKGESEPKSPVPAAPAGSAFGFMNAGAAPAVTAPAAAAFDPLKHVTPTNSQKQMMAVSPDQMQAMMYQQMMMQQQMQMAKMQMAMQQQNRGTNNSQMSFMNMPGHVMQNPAASKSTFAFMDKPLKPEDKSFDFVKDAMKSQK